MSFEIEQRFSELEKLVQSASARGLDEKTASYLCKLGSVLICGNLERCVEHLVLEKVGNASHPRVSNFLKGHFKSGRNYDCENIQQLMFRFDIDWGRAFEAFVIGNERMKVEVASCYAVRNSVAHGGGQSLGPARLKQFFDATFTLVAELEKILR
ncbi:HEPN domain-containing protein [Bradyrhizobium mercantei]|uniref:HEPN domain-containing protein n=1 Tax=Bradyrhizobium mercantei TaxID=1904807 RepID=UPI000975CCB9|nr:HEPN domain-containing protein [Bradyrhizobium mercantei]